MDDGRKLNVYTHTHTHTSKKKRDLIVSIRINAKSWKSFLIMARKIDFTGSSLLNLFVESMISGQSMVKRDAQNYNININIAQPIQQTLVKQGDFKEVFYLSELRKWVGIAQNQLNQGLKVLPKVKERIALLSSKIELPQELKEVIEEILKS
jgi:hypothetical protein